MIKDNPTAVRNNMEQKVDNEIEALVNNMEPITLEEMSSIRLMNRTDSKFIADKNALLGLLRQAGSDYFAQETGGKRIAPYRTIYWDTPEHDFYLAHHNGRSPRRKVRVRTYLDSNLTFLEVKVKNNHSRTKKKRIKVEAPDKLAEAGGDAFIKDMTPFGLDDLKPTLQNQFDRITLVNRAKTERLTIDFNIRFKNFETGLQHGTGDLVIIELKRDGNVFSPVKDMLLRLRVKPSGFSKYCMGTVMTNSDIKQNLFKAKMIPIRRLMGAAGEEACTQKADAQKENN